MGSATGSVTIVEFADFQCPFCARFAESSLRGVTTRYPHDVAVVVRQLPLPYHNLAYPAARAAECASAQHRFASFYDVYRHQDSLGLVPFRQFAERIGVPDLDAFDRCDQMTDRVPAIDSDIALAHALGARGTPAVLVNGQMFDVPPDSVQLDSIVRSDLSRGRR